MNTWLRSLSNALILHPSLTDKSSNILRIGNSGKILVANANLVFEVPDPIAGFGTLIVTHMNDDHMSITVAMVAAAISGLDVSEASITSVDRDKDS